MSGGMPSPQPGLGSQPPQHALARPTTVTYAVYALVATVLLGLIESILVFANANVYLDQALRDPGFNFPGGFASEVVGSTYRSSAIVGVVFVALW
ncbi:MAG: hypothetical protein ACR2I7_10675, partial [Geodermatophilaceae bacterium]